MEQIVKFYPAFDKRSDIPSENYGVHCVDLLMLVRGDKGAVQFRLFTGWYLSHVAKEWEDRSGRFNPLAPIPADLGYHAYKPQYDGQTSMGSCEWLNGADCYYDGSGLNAERIFQIMLTEGSDGVWRELETYYYATFGE